ncbi:hypothetical protein Ancab_031278 [Ancistrocladus abbreviatus]
MEGNQRLSKWLTEIRPWSITEVDERTKRKESFELARMLVLTPEIGLVNEVVRVKVSDRTFSIKVVEEVGGGRIWSGSEVQTEEEREKERGLVKKGKQVSRVDCIAMLKGFSEGATSSEKGNGLLSVRVGLLGVNRPDSQFKTQEEGGSDANISDNLNMWRSLKCKEIAATLSCEVGVEGYAPPANNTAQRRSSKQSATVVTLSCEVGDEGNSPPANSEATRRPMYSNTKSATQIWEVGK